MELDNFSLYILSNLPLISSIWTGISLVWGIVLIITIKFIVKHSYCERYHSFDIWCYKNISILSIIIATYLFFVPEDISLQSDILIVINMIYNLFLLFVSISVVRWWLSPNIVKKF